MDYRAILASAAAGARENFETQGRGAVFAMGVDGHIELMYIPVAKVEPLLRAWNITGKLLRDTVKALRQVMKSYDPATQFVVVIVGDDALMPFVRPLSGPFNLTPAA